MRFGPPLILAGDLEDPATIRNNTDRMMYAIAALLPPERQGSYQKLKINQNDMKQSDDATLPPSPLLVSLGLDVNASPANRPMAYRPD